MAYDTTLDGGYSGRPTYRLKFYVRSNALVGRQRQFAWELYVERPGGFFINTAYPYAIQVGGVGAGGNAAIPDVGSHVTLATGVTGWFTHAADGSLAVSIGAQHVGVGNGFGTAHPADGVLNADNIGWITPGTPSDVPGIISKTDTQFVYQYYGAGGTDATGWTSQVATDPGFTNIISTESSTGGAKTVSGRTPRTTYYIRYRAENPGGSSGWSGTTAVTTWGVPSKPPAPVIGVVTSSSIAFTVGDPSYVGPGLTARTIQLSKSPSFSVIEQTITDATRTFSGLSRTTLYYLRQIVSDSFGASEYSDVESVSTIGSIPSAPTGYYAYDIAATSAKIATGTLSDNGGAVPTQARVKISTTASDVGLIQTMTLPQWAAVPISGLTEGTTYYAAEAAYNAILGGGWGPYGAWVPFSTLANVPTAPSLSLDSASTTTATLEWTPPADLNGSTILDYRLRVGSNASLTANVQEFIIPAGDVSKVVGSLLAGTTYYAAIWTVSSNGLGSTSSIFSFVTDGSGGGASKYWKRIAGVWKQGVWWKKKAGVWKQGVWWKKKSGVWKEGA